MEKFFEKYQDLLLVGMAFMIVGIIAVVFVWSIAVISLNIDKAISEQIAGKSNAHFNLEEVKSLDLRGLVQ